MDIGICYLQVTETLRETREVARQFGPEWALVLLLVVCLVGVMWFLLKENKAARTEYLQALNKASDEQTARTEKIVNAIQVLSEEVKFVGRR